MAYDPINVGATANDKTGDPNRTAFMRVNAMFQELFARAKSGLSGLIAADALTGDYRVATVADISFAGQPNGLATLDGGGKLSTSQIPAALVGAIDYQGTWNAATNVISPGGTALASGVGTKGFYYKVSVAGTTAIDGTAKWAVGDFIVFNGTIWDKIDGIKDALSAANNLSDVADVPTARANLGLAVGTVANTVAAGNDSRFLVIGNLRNLILNGAMLISQEYGTTAQTGLTTGRYILDGVSLTASIGTWTAQQVASVTPSGSPYRARLTCTAGATPGATDVVSFLFPVEGFDVAGLQWGTANAAPFLFRCGFKGPAGTYAFNFRNNAGDRSYVHPFTITAGQANTDTLQTVLVPGDTNVTATWLKDDSGIGLRVAICLACGSTFQTPTADAWQGSNLLCTTAISNGATTGNVFDLFDVAGYRASNLPTGFVPGFDVPSYPEELRRCLRYWCSTFEYGTTPADNLSSIIGALKAFSGTGNATGLFEPSANWHFPVPMRLAPGAGGTSITFYQPFSGAGYTAGQWGSASSALASANVRAAGATKRRVGIDNNNVTLAAGNEFYIQAKANCRL